MSQPHIFINKIIRFFIVRLSFCPCSHRIYRLKPEEGNGVKIHIVQKGDTLWKIAKKYGVSFEELKKVNAQLSNPDMIMPGMKIKVPVTGGTVKKEVGGVKEVKKKKEMPKLEKPYLQQAPMPIKKKEKPKEKPQHMYAPKMPKPTIPEIDINNYYMMNMANMQAQAQAQAQTQAQMPPIMPQQPIHVLPSGSEDSESSSSSSSSSSSKYKMPIQGGLTQPMYYNPCNPCMPMSSFMSGSGMSYPYQQQMMPPYYSPTPTMPMPTMPMQTGVYAGAHTGMMPHWSDESSSSSSSMEMYPHYHGHHHHGHHHHGHHHHMMYRAPETLDEGFTAQHFGYQVPGGYQQEMMPPYGSQQYPVEAPQQYRQGEEASFYGQSPLGSTPFPYGAPTQNLMGGAPPYTSQNALYPPNVYQQDGVSSGQQSLPWEQGMQRNNEEGK